MNNEVTELVEAIDKVFEPVDNTSTQENDEPFEEDLMSVIAHEWDTHHSTYYDVLEAR